MAQAGLAIAYTRPDVASDHRGPPRDIDRWHQIIRGFKRISEPLALYAWSKRCQGMTALEFCDHFIVIANAAGWDI